MIFPPKRTILLLGVILLAISLVVPFLLLPAITAALLSLLLVLGSMFLLILVVEVWFRLAHKKVYGFKYQFVPNLDRDRFIYEPHPFISYVRKTDFRDAPAQEESNNLRATFAAGTARELALPKPAGLIRISCLGASETAFYAQAPEQRVSYPMVLERILRERFPRLEIEVNNFSTSGYTSAEILVEFLLNSFDSEPDVVVIYHAYNDIRAFLTPGFKRDYSHFRRNFAEEYERLRIVNLLPFLPLHFYNFLLWEKLPKRIVERDVHYAVTKGKMDIEAEPVGLDTYQRNLEHIINICRANGIYNERRHSLGRQPNKHPSGRRLSGKYRHFARRGLRGNLCSITHLGNT